MSEEMRIEHWRGYGIRFIKYENEWWAVLKDICEALGLSEAWMEERIDINYLEKIVVPSKNPRSTRRYLMIVVCEEGIFDALQKTRRLEFLKFRKWSADFWRTLRKHVGLEEYEALNITEPEFQEEIDNILDSIYYDEETGQLMRSVTLPGGDVDQIPFE